MEFSLLRFRPSYIPRNNIDNVTFGTKIFGEVPRTERAIEDRMCKRAKKVITKCAVLGTFKLTTFSFLQRPCGADCAFQKQVKSTVLSYFKQMRKYTFTVNILTCIRIYDCQLHELLPTCRYSYSARIENTK